LEGEEESEGEEEGETEGGEEQAYGEEEQTYGEGEEGGLIESAWSAPPAVTLLACALFLGLAVTYCLIRRHKTHAVVGKTN
jgi:hypothetical protein